jgi:hypothetical protein
LRFTGDWPPFGRGEIRPFNGSPSIFSARRDIYNCGMPDIGCAKTLFETHPFADVRHAQNEVYYRDVQGNFLCGVWI